jgi:predicted amidohydrolase
MRTADVTPNPDQTPAPHQRLRVLLAQIKPKKADYAHNLGLIGDLFTRIVDEKIDVDVLCLPETAMSGYFLEGGVREVAVTQQALFADLQRTYRERLGRRQAPTRVLDVVVGFYEVFQGKYYNACLYATLGPDDGAARIVHCHRKFFLPTYGVFDEKRFVGRGRNFDAFPTRFGFPVATAVCEDLWHSITGTILALKGAQVIFVISASPGRGFGSDLVENVDKWRQLLVNVADEHNVFVCNTGLVGFEGGKGFVGVSTVIDPFGRTRIEAPLAQEALVLGEIELDDIAIARASSPMLSDLESALADVLYELNEVERREHHDPLLGPPPPPHR